MAVVLPARVVQQREFVHGAGLSWEDLALAWRLDDEISARRLRRALGALVARHESLRSSLMRLDGEVVQRVAPADGCGPPLELIELPARAAGGSDPLADALLPLRRERIDLGGERLVRTLLMRGPGEARHLVVLAPHALLDAWSSGVLERELNELLSGARPSPLAVQVGDVAAWEAATASRRAGGARRDPPAPLPLPRVGRARDRLDFDPELTSAAIGAAELAALGRVARGAGATPTTALAAALAALVSAATGGERLTLALQESNRDRPELRPLIGSLTDLTLIDVTVELERGFDALLETVAAALRAARADPLPAEAQLPVGVDPLARAPFADVVFNRVPRRVAAPGRPLRRVPLRNGSIRRRTGANPWGCQITLNLLDEADGSATALGMFNRLVFERAEMAATVAAFGRLVAAVGTEPRAPIASLLGPLPW